MSVPDQAELDKLNIEVERKLAQIGKDIIDVSWMYDDLVEHRSNLIDQVKEHVESCLQFLQKMLSLAAEEDDVGTLDSAVGSGSLAESTSLNTEVRASNASNATGGRPEAVRAEQKEELENLPKLHELVKKILEQQEQVRALQGRQEALMSQEVERKLVQMHEDIIKVSYMHDDLVEHHCHLINHVKEQKKSYMQFLQEMLSSVFSAVSHQGLLRKVPIAASSPATAQAPSSSGAKTKSAVLKPTVPEAATSSVTDNEFWSEIRRHLRQRRKHLESLMAEQQRRSGLGESPCQVEDQEGIATPSQPVSRDERTMATWGSDNTSNDDIHVYSPSRNLCSYSDRKDQGSNLKPPAAFSGECGGLLHNKTKAKQQSRSLNQSASQHGGTRRQENLRWASELSFTEGSYHWQEQVNQLQRQLDFSTSMCQTLLQDQQTLSDMLQTLLTGQYSMLPNNLSSPQVHLITHQLNQCYTQLAWQQHNIQRLKQVFNDLLRQQQQQPPPSSSSAGHVSDSVGSTADSVQERADMCHQKEQNQSVLDKLTQEKVDSKAKIGSKRNDLSSGLSKAETQALTNYVSGEDEDEEEEIKGFEAGPIDVRTFLQASAD